MHPIKQQQSFWQDKHYNSIIVWLKHSDFIFNSVHKCTMQDGTRCICMKQDRVNQQCDVRDMKEALASDIQMSGPLISFTIENGHYEE